MFNTDGEEFGGQGQGDKQPLKTQDIPCHDQEQSMAIDLPPMSVMIYRCTRKNPPRKAKKEGEKGKAQKADGAKGSAAPKKGKAVRAVLKKKDEQA